MNEILNLMDKYIQTSNDFWDMDKNPDIDENNNLQFNEKTLNWMKDEWKLMDEMDNIKKQILKIIGDDRELFNKYLCLSSCIRNEDYEQAEIFKNEILNYGK